MASAASPLPFSVGATIGSAWTAFRQAPGSTIGVTVLLTLPVFPTLLAIRGVLHGGGASALQGIVAGAARDTPGAIVLRPERSGVLLLVLLAALLVLVLAWVASAGLVVGATRASRSELTALRAWPALAITLIVQLLLFGAALATLAALGAAASRIQFQLGTPLLTVGVVALVIVAIRVSLWPTVALDDQIGVVRAVGRTWRQTRGHVLRVTEAAAAVLAAVALPALIVAAIFRLVLVPVATQLGLTSIAPATADLYALLPLALALPIGGALWGLVAGELAVAIRRAPAAASDGAPTAS
ncbi:MAG: hypothetical protein QM679_06520 [Patulibacter sp.]